MLLLSLSGDLFHYITHWLTDVEYVAWIQTCTTIGNSFKSHQYSSKVDWCGLNDLLNVPDHIVKCKAQLYDKNLFQLHQMNLSQWQNIQHLSLKVYNHPITQWPSQLKSLTLDTWVQQPLDLLPNTLVRLVINYNYKSDFAESLDYLPLSLTYFKLVHYHTSYCCVVSLDHLPPQLHTLCLKIKYNQPLDHLPSSLQVLQLEGSFNQPLDYLPGNLKILEIPLGFDQPLDYLPTSLTQLILNNNYFRKMDHLPKGLQTLKLSTYHGHLDYLPSSLMHFENSVYFDHHSNRQLNHLPLNLQTLNINDMSSCESLPIHLHQLWLNYPKQSCLSTCHTLLHLKILRCNLEDIHPPIIWPPQLTHLIIENNSRDFDLGILPDTLQYLTLDNLNDSTCSRWPNSLKYLDIRGHITTSKIPHNQIETISSQRWHKTLNQSQFPYLKCLMIDSVKNDDSFAWSKFDTADGLHDYEFSVHTRHRLGLPLIWPLKLFHLSSFHVHVSIVNPWSYPLSKTDYTHVDFSKG
jgi:hypothetical protein